MYNLIVFLFWAVLIAFFKDDLMNVKENKDEFLRKEKNRNVIFNKNRERVENLMNMKTGSKEGKM